MNKNQRDYTEERLRQLEAKKEEANPKFVQLISNMFSGWVFLSQSISLIMEKHIDKVEITTMSCAAAIFCMTSFEILNRNIKVRSLETEIDLLKYSLEMDRLASNSECTSDETRKAKKMIYSK